MSADVQGVGPPIKFPISPGVQSDNSGSLPITNIGTSNSSKVEGIPMEVKFSLIESAVFFSSIVPESRPSHSGWPKSTNACAYILACSASKSISW